MRDRLVPPMLGSALWGWLGPLIVTVFGAFLRFHRIGLPEALAFDETHYAKDALSTVTFGVERHFVENADELLLAGLTDDLYKNCDQLQECAGFVVHPPLGKWLIGLGELLFGANPYGWRFAAAVIGSLSILILARVALRMTRSIVLGCLAGFLLSLDGLHFVMSRAAMLDIFLMFWVLAGFACLVVDRDRARERLADWHDASASAVRSALLDQPGPRLGLRPWRLAAGACLGAAFATKWTGLFYIAAFAIMSVLWDAGARRAVGLRRPYAGALRLDVPLATAWLAVVPILLYVTSFAGWFASDKGWGRNWAQATSGGPFTFVFESLSSWVAYHRQMLGFSTGLAREHSSMSEPWSWPLLLRPIWFYGKHDITPPDCDVARCVSDLRAVGTPVIWYVGLIALIAMIAWYTATRDWRAGTVLVAYAAGWLPWFYFAITDNRTMFLFYALPMLPFMILAIVLAFGLIIGPADASSRRRALGIAATGAFALLVLTNFWWLYPILTAEIIPYEEWQRRMFDSWR